MLRTRIIRTRSGCSLLALFRICQCAHIRRYTPQRSRSDAVAVDRNCPCSQFCDTRGCACFLLCAASPHSQHPRSLVAVLRFTLRPCCNALYAPCCSFDAGSVHGFALSRLLFVAWLPCWRAGCGLFSWLSGFGFGVVSGKALVYWWGLGTTKPESDTFGCSGFEGEGCWLE